MKNWREGEFYKRLDLYTACSIAEGFDDEEPTDEEFFASWQWLSDTGHCWHLQGFYGRTVVGMLEEGLIQPPIKTHRDYYGNTVHGTEEAGEV